MRKILTLSMLMLICANMFAQIDTHEVGDMGYLRTPMETSNGIIITNNRYSEIYALDGENLTPILQGRNCGLYTNLSPDGKYLGYKSFNDNDEQAPAVLDVATGIVTLLEDYVHQCGQVSFANDGTMAYTMGNRLIVRKGNTRKAFDLGFYTNIANISPDATKVAYSNIDGRMFVIDVTTGAKENVAITDGYRAIWSPDGSKMAVHTAVGTIAVQDRTNKKIYNLGEGESASWANNSDELILTRIERKNDMEVMGSSIKKINFDGTGELTLVNTSDNLPVDAIITRDNKLYVPYQTGAKRGLVVKDLVGGITPSAASVKEKVIISYDEEQLVGTRLANPCDNPNIKPAITTNAFQQSIGATAIEYLSQIYDSPSVSGCTRYGYVTCAPTSACMYLGYYGLLNQKATTSRYDGSTKYYAYAIGQTFTNQAGTYTFNLTKYKYCAYIPGAYGYMWNTGSPQSNIINFMKLNGCLDASQTYTASTAWSRFQTESAAGRPYIICGLWSSSGHVVLGFATNCKYRSSTGFTQQTGSFVCHDPYGDYNDSSWADGDGYHSTYDWVGYNNGQGNIGTHAWSVQATPPNSANPGNQTPGIIPSTYNVNLSCNVGETATATVTLDGNMLNQWTTVQVVSPEEGIFSVTPDGLNVSGTTHDFDPENPTITISFTPNKAGTWGGDINGDEFIDYYVVLHSVDVNGDDVYQWIAINGTATAPTTQSYISVTPNNIDFNCNVGETASAEVTVDGNLLNMWTTVEVSEKAQGIFSVTPTGLQVDGSTHNFSEGHTKLTITFSPTEAGTWSGDVDGDGYNDYYVVLHSVDVDGKDVYQWVILNGTATGTSTPSTQPYISVTPNNLEFNCNVGESETIEVTVDGNLLNMWTTVEVSEKAQGIFSVTPTGLQVDGSTHNFSEGHTTLYITFSPTEAGTWSGDVDGDGYNDYYVVLHSVDVNGNDVYQWVILNGTATGTSTPSTDPYISVTPNYLEFNCSAGETQTLEVTVDGYLLNHWTYVDLISPEAGIFSVTPTGLQVDGSTHNFSEGWTTLYVTFSPKNAGTWGGDINNDGLADYYITLRSIDVNGNDVYQWIYLYGTATGTSSIENIDSEIVSTRIVGKELYVSGETPASIEVFSTAGAVAAQCNDSSTLNIASLPAGIYIVKIVSADGKTSVEKLSIK